MIEFELHHTLAWSKMPGTGVDVGVIVGVGVDVGVGVGVDVGGKVGVTVGSTCWISGNGPRLTSSVASAPSDAMEMVSDASASPPSRVLV